VIRVKDIPVVLEFVKNLGSLLLWGEKLTRIGLRIYLDEFPDIRNAVIEVLCNVGETLIRSMYQDICLS